MEKTEPTNTDNLNKSPEEILRNTETKYKKGANRVKKITNNLIKFSLLSALAYYSSFMFYDVYGEIYKSHDNQVLAAESVSNEILEDVSPNFKQSIFQFALEYGPDSIWSGPTGFAIEQINVRGPYNGNKKCITTLVQSHQEIKNHERYGVGLRLQGDDKITTTAHFWHEYIPYRDGSIYSSGWDFVAMCFPNNVDLTSLTYVGIDAFDQYSFSTGKTVVSLGLPGILDSDSGAPTLFASRHKIGVDGLLVGGTQAAGASGGMLLSENDKIVGTILSGPQFKGFSVVVQTIDDITEFKYNYDNFKQRAVENLSY